MLEFIGNHTSEIQDGIDLNFTNSINYCEIIAKIYLISL